MDNEAFIQGLREATFDTWRSLDYDVRYMYFPEEVMKIIREVVKAERRAFESAKNVAFAKEKKQ